MLGCPWRMLFSRADAALIASSGKASSINFLRRLMGWSLVMAKEWSSDLQEFWPRPQILCDRSGQPENDLPVLRRLG